MKAIVIDERGWFCNGYHPVGSEVEVSEGFIKANPTLVKAVESKPEKEKK